MPDDAQTGPTRAPVRGRPVGRLIGLVAWTTSLLLAIWAAARLFGAESGFPLVALIAFTPYVAAVAVVACLLIALLRHRGAAAVAGLSALALLAVVVPRALPLQRAEVAPGTPRLRILTANVAMGQVPVSALARLVRRHHVDVLSLQELTPDLARQLTSSPFRKLLPHTRLRPRPSAAGTGLLARRPLEAAAPPEAANAVAAARARWPQFGAITFVSVHPPPPTRAQPPRWEPDLRALPPAGRGGDARVLAGDFNATLDHAELRRVLDAGYRDVAASVGAGLSATWPSQGPLPRVAIDHVLIPRDWRALRAQVLALPGSDHRAVLAEIAPPPKPVP